MAVSGAAQKKGQQESKCHRSRDITQYLVESIRQIIGMARFGFERLIAQKMTL